MDKHLAVNVYDADNHAVTGAEVTFRIKSGEQEIEVGPVQTQGIKDKPASVQIPEQADPIVEVTARFGDEKNTVLVDMNQTNTTIIRLQSHNLPTRDELMSRQDGRVIDRANPLQVLNLARKAVPAVNFALGIAGIAAAGALIALFVGQTKASVVLISLIFIGMVLLFLFSQLVISTGRSNQIAGSVLLWSVLLFFVTFMFFTVTAFAAEWPKPWASFLGISVLKSAPT